MNIFDKRPLSLILCVMLGGFVLFSSEKPLLRYCVILAIAVLLLVYTVLKLIGRRKIILILCALSLICSAIFSYLYFDLWFKADKRFSDEATIYGTVESVDFSTYSTTYVVKSETVDLKPMTKYRLLLRLPSDEDLDLKAGSVVLFKAEIAGFKSTEDFDSKSYYYSSGINAEAINAKDITIIDRKEESTAAKLEYAREYIRRYACTLSDADSGTLLAALLFGERDSLSAQIRLDFKRIGITHVLALSGMHLAILVLGIGKLLSLVGVSKKPRTLITVFFTIIYMVFTGLTVSVVRAGIMLIISSMLYLFARGQDSVTSLTLAVVLICFITPYAIYDLSLWLSAFATLGILLFGDYSAATAVKAANVFHKMLQWLSLAFLSSVFAIIATFFITAFEFNAISVIAPVSTIIFSVLIEAIMYIGSIMLIVGKIIPIGKLLIPIVKLAELLAAEMSSVKWIYSHSDFYISKALIVILVIAFFLFAVLNVKHKRIYVGALSSAFIAILALTTVLNLSVVNDDGVIYTSESKYDAFVVKSDGETSFINSSQYSDNLAYSSRDFLSAQHISYLNNYFITHYSWSLSSDLEIMLSYLPIESIYLPEPRNEDENTILARLKNTTEKFRTNIVLIKPENKVSIGSCDFTLLYSSTYGEGASTNVFDITTDSRKLLYLSSGTLNTEDALKWRNEMNKSYAVIHGSHGKKYTNDEIMSRYYSKNEIIVLSSSNLYFTQEAYALYIKNGCEIYSHPQTIDILLFDN